MSSRPGLESHVLLVDMVSVGLSDKLRIRKNIGRHAELEEDPFEDAKKDLVELLVLSNLRQVRVVPLCRRDKSIENDL